MNALYACRGRNGCNTEFSIRRLDTDEELMTEASIDIHAVLRATRLIAHIWGIGDVKSHRLDLTDDQAWHVLQHVQRQLDSELGITWETIEWAADDLYPDDADRHGERSPS